MINTIDRCRRGEPHQEGYAIITTAPRSRKKHGRRTRPQCPAAPSSRSHHVAELDLVRHLSYDLGERKE